MLYLKKTQMIRFRTNDRSAYRPNSNPWQNCTNLRAIKQAHASMIVTGFNSDASTLREFIFATAVAISSTIDYAHQAFAFISQPDTFMWNSIIRGSARSGDPSKAIHLYARMTRRQVATDRFTFPHVFKACTKLSWISTGFAVHGKVVKLGFASNKYVENALINFHANCGDLSVARALFDQSEKTDVVAWSSMTAGYARRGNLIEARKLFDEMPVRDLVSWNVMITGYAKQRDMSSAKKLFDNVPRRDVVTWNVMIAGHVSSGENAAALETFREMGFAGAVPDEVTMLSLLSACADSGDLEAGEAIHRHISSKPSVLLGNALVHMYAKCGSVEKALGVFSSMPRKDVATWNSAIGGLAVHGHADEALRMFRKMLETSRIRPDEVTFVAVLVACSHAGKVEEGRGYFNMMRGDFGITPNVRHCGCVVDILGRAGRLVEAFRFVETMGVEPNGVVWRALLGACRVHGDVELGRRASEALLRIRVDESGDYVLLSNIYAARGEWDGAERVRKSMDDCGVVKEAGYSLIEADYNSLDQLLEY